MDGWMDGTKKIRRKKEAAAGRLLELIARKLQLGLLAERLLLLLLRPKKKKKKNNNNNNNNNKNKKNMKIFASTMPRRTVQEVTVQDVQKRRNPNKHYVYIIKVFWSDGSTEIIYRRYSKFFDLQVSKIFRETHTHTHQCCSTRVRDSDSSPTRELNLETRDLTWTRALNDLNLTRTRKILFRRSHIRDVAMKRLRPINEYCRALIQLPVYISQCEEVRVFFETRPEDLNPPKEEPIGKKKSGIVERASSFLKRGDTSSTDPLLLDQYVAVTDYEKQESSEISLHVGQVVEVIEKNESGWWFVSSEDAQGWVPATCLEAQDDPDDFSLPGEEVPRRFWSLPRHVGRRRTLGDLFSTGCGPEEKYSVVYPYSARDQDEIDLEKGMVVEVIQKNLEGWWKIRYQGREGWAPASYLKKADMQAQKQSAGGAAHASTSDLEGSSRQVQQNNGAKDAQKDNKLSPFSDGNKLKMGLRQRPPPRRDLTIPRGANLPKPPTPPQVEEEFYTIADFQTTIPDGISFQAGIKVEVIEKNSSGWWYIQIDDKEGWAPITFIDKYKKTSNALRPNFLAPLPNEMEKLRLEDGSGGAASSSSTWAPEDSWSKPLPDEPSAASESCARPKLRDWKSGGSKGSSALFSEPLPPAPSAPPLEEKPALPPRRESINKSVEVEVPEKPKADLSKPLPPKPPAPGVILPLVTPKAAPPFRQERPPEPKKEDKNKPLHLKNEMGLECGHKISAKEVKKFNLKPVPKQPPKPRAEPPEENPEPAGPALFTKPKPSVRPKPPPIPTRAPLPAIPPSTSPAPLPSTLNNGKPVDEPRLPPKQLNGHRHEGSPPPAKPCTPPNKEPPQRPPTLAPRRPPPPKKSDPSSPTETPRTPPHFPREAQEGTTRHELPPLNRPPPPKPKAFVLPPPPRDREREEPKVNKAPVPPKPQVKGKKPAPPRDKLPPLIKEASGDELYLAVADFEGDGQTAGFKAGAMFEVMEKNGSGWWFCKNVGEEHEGWIPSNYLSKKP
ncbi:SH3 and PX domain-containing protein 2B [Merluccius polli]|uniref:SH3 and PX domain-containing protein 2B n=1 Tax=Merluccius polli TaxID=89951 RepID=A0AA47M6U3_MERPO|nr:SH3 and PX domain-containing protein 2B [Merluccius polli]